MDAYATWTHRAEFILAEAIPGPGSINAGQTAPVQTNAKTYMIAWRLLETAQIPEGGKLRLMRRGAEFSIMLDDKELMNSRRGGSEEALAALACERVRRRKEPQILIGGLGMGFTLRAALAALGRDARITVAELVPDIVSWTRGPLAEVFGESLADPRIRIQQTDVGKVITSGMSAFDAIILDVDNGSEGITRKANDALYTIGGLRAARAALRPEGVLAVWSSGPSLAFMQRLRNTGFEVEEMKVRANGSRGGARHIVWLATNPGRG